MFKCGKIIWKRKNSIPSTPKCQHRFTSGYISFGAATVDEYWSRSCKHETHIVKQYSYSSRRKAKHYFRYWKYIKTSQLPLTARKTKYLLKSLTTAGNFLWTSFHRSSITPLFHIYTGLTFADRCENAKSKFLPLLNYTKNVHLRFENSFTELKKATAVTQMFFSKKVYNISKKDLKCSYSCQGATKWLLGSLSQYSITSSTSPC